MYLSRYASSVTMVVRGSSLARSMSQYLVSQIESHEKIAVWPHSTVAEVDGDARLEEITIAEATTGDTQRVPAFALLPLSARSRIPTGSATWWKEIRRASS
jgi:thioredoxin reductase (NADPH)